jgi:hypothetical protein
MTETKTCKACAEDIRATAKVCPHCRQSQWLLFSRSPLIVIPLSVILFFAILTLMTPNRAVFTPGAKFQDHAGEIVVRESSFGFDDCSTCKSALQVTTVGVLDNTGEHSWERLSFEVRYLDAAGQLIDTVSSHEYSLVVPARGETAFRVKGAAAKPKDAYASHRVVVKDAEDLDAWP